MYVANRRLAVGGRAIRWLLAVVLVTATVLAGGVSSPSVVLAEGQDAAPPTVSVTSPTNGSKVSGAVSVTADAADDTGVARVEFRINGRLIGTDTTAPYSMTWNAPSAVTAGPVVSFTFDDGLDAQYTGCYPILAAAGYPATTYVHSGDNINDYDWKLCLPSSPRFATTAGRSARTRATTGTR